jgi:hypothetical protein
MNNQAAQTMPDLPRPYWKAGEVKDDFGNTYNETDLFTDDDMRAMYQKGYAAALSQPAGVPDGWKLVPVIPTEEMIARGDEIIAEDGKRVRPESIYDAMVSGAPAVSGGECHKPCTPIDFFNGDACPDCVTRDYSPQPPSGASVSERATVSLDLNNLPTEWPWDEGSPCLDPRPVGMVYPAVPTPRAFGYLDKTGVEWAAYDTGQMEDYGRRAFADGANTVLHAVDQVVNDLWSSDEYRRGWSDCAMTNGLNLEQALTQQHALSSPRQEVDSTAASTQGLREYITRIKEAHKHAATYSLTEYEKGWTRRGKVIADELESLLTSPTTGADGEKLMGRGADHG